MNVTSKNWRDLFVECPKIFLNDKEMFGVIEADDTAGYIVMEKRNDQGYLILDVDRDRITTVKFLGEVKLVGKLKSAPASEENAA